MLRVFAISMMKDEEDVAEHAVRHLICSGVDGIIVADNLSTDSTRQKLEQVSNWAATNYPQVEVTILDDPDPAYNQWIKMTALARMAGKRGANIILPFDADEIWFSEKYSNLKEYFTAEADNHLVFEATMYNHVATSYDGTTGNPFLDLHFRRQEPWPAKKVAFRFQEDAVLDQGNHVIAYASKKGETLSTTGGLQVRHFQWRSAQQFLRKIRNGAQAYRLTTLPETIGAHWRSYGEVLETQGKEAALAIFYDNFFVQEPQSSLLEDPCPLRMS